MRRRPQPCPECDARAFQLVRVEAKLRDAERLLGAAARGRIERSAVRLARKALRMMTEWTA
jgi:hypothetical protein